MLIPAPIFYTVTVVWTPVPSIQNPVVYPGQGTDCLIAEQSACLTYFINMMPLPEACSWYPGSIMPHLARSPLLVAEISSGIS